MAAFGRNRSSGGLLKGPGMSKAFGTRWHRGVLKGPRGSYRVRAGVKGAPDLKRRGCVKGAGPLKGQKAFRRGMRAVEGRGVALNGQGLLKGTATP